jgi:hypothetical protein
MWEVQITLVCCMRDAVLGWGNTSVYDVPEDKTVVVTHALPKVAPGKFEVKRRGALEHRNDGMTVLSGGYSASNFAGSADGKGHRRSMPTGRGKRLSQACKRRAELPTGWLVPRGWLWTGPDALSASYRYTTRLTDFDPLDETTLTPVVCRDHYRDALSLLKLYCAVRTTFVQNLSATSYTYNSLYTVHKHVEISPCHII